MSSEQASVSGSPAGKKSFLRRIGMGLLVLVLGGLALAAPFVMHGDAPFILGLVMLATGLLQNLGAFSVGDQRGRASAFFGSTVSMIAGALLIASPKLVFAGMALFLGLTFAFGGLVAALTALRRREQTDWLWTAVDGFINVLIGAAIAIQWPVPGVMTIGIFVGIRTVSAGAAMIFSRPSAASVSEAETAGLHPDSRLRLPSHDEIAQVRTALESEEQTRWRTDRYWRWTFVLTFFAIHVGRMEADWNLVGMLSPAIATAGDVCIALVLAFGLVVPVRLAWRALTRPVERRCWQRLLTRADQGQGPGLTYRTVRRWLVGRMRFSLQVRQALSSPTGALGRGLQIGLPLTAIMVATVPIWGFTWFFNTENWATGVWQKWAEFRTDPWREEMIRAVLGHYQDSGIAEETLFQVSPEGIGGAGDFNFIVIGDTGEGDPSQHILRDQFLSLGKKPEIKFLVVASDVIYPLGAMKHYEPKFYLPFKGFTKPIYAIPGNHDWYDALEAFAANFLEAPSARLAMQARRIADQNLTTTTEAKIDAMIDEAERLRSYYGVRTGLQKAPFFEIQTDDFALIAVDTGTLRTLDAEQRRWFLAALERARGKFKLIIPGHPLYAGGRYQGTDDKPFRELHELLREHEVDVVMAGDTHFFEYYREPYTSGGKERTMYHFVDGGGGAYLSIGTPFDWPREPALADSAYYPRADALTEKLDRETPVWKWPLWLWVRHFRAWPSSSEAVASAFDFNHAPFFQSFVEVRVECSTRRIRLFPYGVNGRLHWRDLQLHGQAMPADQKADDFVEFVVPMR